MFTLIPVGVSYLQGHISVRLAVFLHGHAGQAVVALYVRRLFFSFYCGNDANSDLFKDTLFL